MIYHLCQHGIVEIGNAGVIERDMSVLPDAEDAHVQRVLCQQRGIACGFKLRVCRRTVDVIHRFERKPSEYRALQKARKAGGVIGRNTDILIHMKGVHAPPVDILFLQKLRKHLVLRRRGGKHHVQLVLCSEQEAQRLRRVAARLRSHCGAGVVDLYMGRAHIKAFH